MTTPDEPGELIWAGSIPDHDKTDGTLKPVRIVRVGFEIRNEQLDGWDSMGVERWNPLEHRLAWRLIEALACRIEELARG